MGEFSDGRQSRQSRYGQGQQSYEIQQEKREITVQGYSNTDSISGFLAGPVNMAGPVLQSNFQKFTASGTVSLTGSSIVFISGTTPSQTLTLPSSPVIGQIYTIINQSNQAWSLTGNGINIGTASAARTLSTNVSVVLIYDGNQWSAIGPSPVSLTLYNSSQQFVGNIVASGTILLSVQTSNATYVASATPPVILFTGSTTSQTVTLPASPTVGQIMKFNNQASVSVTLAANTGQTLYLTSISSGTATVTSGSITVPANGYLDLVYTATNTWVAK
jgi:hypothetical protein